MAAQTDSALTPEIHRSPSPDPQARASAEPADGDLASTLPQEIPETPLEALARLRDEAEAFLEHMLAVLDMLDGNPDLEDDGTAEHEPDKEDGADDEPDLGSLGQRSQVKWANGEDAEPSLGSVSSYSQSFWASGTTEEAEGCEHDGREPDDGDWEPDNEGEPTLGSLDRMADQHRWAHGNNDGEDHELDDSDREPSLGSLEGWPAGSVAAEAIKVVGGAGQTLWANSDRSDREWDGDDLEEDHRNEPADDGAAFVIDQTETVRP